MKSALIIPTWNAKSYLGKLLPALKALNPQPDTILFIDSASTDGTLEMLKAAGYTVHPIRKEEFGHGKTRNLGARLCPGHEVLIYLTQDAIPASHGCVRDILAPFAQKEVAVVCGRQLPHDDATLASRFARLHNYPAESRITTAADIPSRGLKALFCSNSFAAYRAAALQVVGGFPETLPMGEDLAVTGRLLEAGYSSVYEAKSCVYHSHNYTPLQEFKRYFDIGALLKVDPWLAARPMKTGGEGWRYVVGEWRYTAQHGTWADRAAIFPRTLAKYIGFHLGRVHGWVPRRVKKRVSMHAYFWQEQTS